MYTRRILGALVAVLSVIVGCGDDADPAGTADGGAASDGAAADGAAASPDTVCHDACANVARCVPRTDQAACRAQCGKELAGEGFLAREVAEIAFQSLTPSLDAECLPPSLDPKCDAKSFDDKCGVLGGSGGGWGFRPFPSLADLPGGENYDRLASKPKLIECAKKTAAFCNGDPELLEDCFTAIYRYRASTVALLEPCLARTYEGEFSKCYAYGQCVLETTDIKGQPWLGPGFAE
jgi:hypothetical protein